MYRRNTKKKVLICLIGTDGSGKTSQAKKLLKTLQKAGIHSKYVLSRWNPLFLKPFMVIGAFILLNRKKIAEVKDDYIALRDSKRNIFKHKFLTRMWWQLVLIDYFLQIFFKVYIHLIQGKTLICDRYLYDIIVGQSVNFNYSFEETRDTLKNRFLSVFPKPDLVFFLDTPPEVAFQRKDDIPSIDYLVDRRKLYSQLAEVEGWIKLDGSLEMEKLQCIIKDRVFKELSLSKDKAS